MAYNPYGAPAAQGPQWSAPVGPPGQPVPWEPGEVMGRAWDIVKLHWVPLVFATLIAGGAGGLPQQISAVYRGVALHGEFDFTDPIFSTLFSIGSLVGLALQAFFQVGLVRLNLAAARGQTPELSQVFSGGSRFLPMLGAMLLHMILVSVGMMLLVVPGIVLLLGLGMYPYFVVEREMAPVEALKASWELTTGHKGKLFVLGLYAFGVALLGFVACCVGVLASAAVISVAQAMVFTRMTGTVEPPSPPAPNYPSPYGPPPGAYGGPPGGYGGYYGPR